VNISMGSSGYIDKSNHLCYFTWFIVSLFEGSGSNNCFINVLTSSDISTLSSFNEYFAFIIS
jgi:hypothetical protein